MPYSTFFAYGPNYLRSQEIFYDPSDYRVIAPFKTYGETSGWSVVYRRWPTPRLPQFPETYRGIHHQFSPSDRLPSSRSYKTASICQIDSPEEDSDGAV